MRCLNMNAFDRIVVGSGGGAGWVGGSGGGVSQTDSASTYGAPGTSFLADPSGGRCTGLTGNSGNGYVTVTPQ